MTVIINPRQGPFVNRELAFGGEVALSSLGRNLIKAFNHLRQFRAGEYIASYNGRVNPAINGNNLSRFHIITRFPVQSEADDVQIVITQKNWLIGYAAVNEKTEWSKVFGGGVTETPYDALAPPIAVANDTSSSKPHGAYHEYEMTLTPVAIGVADGFRCSRLDITNAVVHQLNVFGCPIEPNLDADEAVVSLSDAAVGRVLQGYVDGVDDGTVGALVHYLDADDSVVHNTCRPLLNTPYALGVHLNNEAALIPIRRDGNNNAMTYKVKPRNLTGAAGDVACDPAIVAWGDAAAEIQFVTTVGNSTKYTIPGGGLAVPTLITTTDFTGKLDVDPDGDFITINALSGAGNDVYINAVSLWESYQHR